MKMISFAVKKGGVGKTTMCKNIAYKLVKDGYKVLLIDLDPQATLSVQFLDKNANRNLTITKILGSIDMLSVSQIIQKTKFANLDIIVGGEDLNKSSVLINTFYEKNKYLIADKIYDNNKKIFDDYNYVLIDYPPTIQELGMNWLLLSDLVIMPINSGAGSYKGLVDLKNTLNQICREENREVPDIKVVFNNVKDNENLSFILNWLQDNNLHQFLSDTFISNSDTFIKTENDFGSIWNNQYYWRQKSAYEEIIKEIL